MGNGVSAQMNEDRINKVQALVRDGDYSKCPVPHQGEVQEFLVDGVAALIRGQNGNGNGKIKWGNFEATGMAATMVARIAGVLALLYILWLLHGGTPIPFRTVAEAAGPESAVAEVRP